MSADDDLTEVRILRLPLAVHHRSQQHSEELNREFQLIVDSAPAVRADVPQRLLELIAALSARYSGFTDEQESRIERAIAAGEEYLDEIVFRVPAHAAEAAVAIRDMLDEADEFCRAGQHLLTLATPEFLVGYRNWYLDEFVAQIGGAQPTPWMGPSRPPTG